MKLTACDYAEAVLERERRECRRRWVQHRSGEKFARWCIDHYGYTGEERRNQEIGIATYRERRRWEAAARMSIGRMERQKREAVRVQRMVGRLWETFDRRASTWQRDEGELGDIIATELRTLNNAYLELSDELGKPPNVQSSATSGPESAQ